MLSQIVSCTAASLRALQNKASAEKGEITKCWSHTSTVFAVSTTSKAADTECKVKLLRGHLN